MTASSDYRDATGLNLSSFGLIKLLIFGFGPSPSLGPILIVELRALGVELRAIPRAFTIIVLNDLNACFGGFSAYFFTLLYKSTLGNTKMALEFGLDAK